MRVTNKLMADTVTGNLFKNIDQFLKTQNILFSGKRINKPSDDPIGMGKVLDYRKTIWAIDQYDRNIAHGESWLDLTDSTLNAVGDSLIRAKELALSQANATANADTMKAVAEEVKNIYDYLLQLANTKLGNSYIFAGHKTDTSPFSRDDDYIASYNGEAEVTDITCIADIAGSLDGKYLTLSSPSTDYYVWYNVAGDSAEPVVAGIGIGVDILTDDSADTVASKTYAAINNIVGLGAELSGDKVTVTNAAAGDVVNSVDNDSGFSITTITQGTDGDKNGISIIAGENVEIDINVNGDEIFLSKVNIFEVLRELKASLEENDSDAISDQLGPLDDALDQILKARANVGAKLNRLEATENHWADFKLNITQMLSDTEDADMIKTVTDLASQEAAYQASLAASARIIQPSLIDFLR
ncbi:MAG: flagellar hook-associated protein FlgL [Deltaproteobacteria bacterium]|jgi:flagellar hook-associated protein 3 FlgL|nr:flagellar hook-associated protein FlgL [Deltaproteobacteria bacterium]